MTTKTDSALSEAISSTVDGEHNDIDLQRVLSALDKEGSREQVSQSIKRYQMIGNVMRGEDTSIVGVDISGSVMAAIEAEDTYSETSAGSGKSRLSPLWFGAGKTAVAASVMLAVVFGAQTFNRVNAPDQSLTSPVAAGAIPAANDASTLVGDAVPNGFELPPLTARTVSTNSFNARPVLPRSPVSQNVTPIIIENDDYQKELNRLLFKHAENSSSAGTMGALPYTRLPENSTQVQGTK